MDDDGLALLKRVAQVFKSNREEILNNWLTLTQENSVVSNSEESEVFRGGFTTLLDDFLRCIPDGNIGGYYMSNAHVGRKIASYDIPYGQFIRAFHLFEDSYGSVLRRSFTREELYDAYSVLDHLHHETIAIVSEAYFDLRDTTIFAIAKLAELRDPETEMHLERTRDYSVLLSQHLKLDYSLAKTLYRVGPLHDIGKVGIPDAILLKPGPLTANEYETMKQHTVIGADAIQSIIGQYEVSRGYLFIARDIILHHHERWDGAGYPDGLKGEAIPLAARIFAVADAYDAIVSARPYKPALPHEEAVRRIRIDIGKHFDPRVGSAFLEVAEGFRRIHERYQDQPSKFSLVHL